MRKDKVDHENIKEIIKNVPMIESPIAVIPIEKIIDMTEHK